MNWPVFAHPWMLAGLAAAGLPVLIHFLTRARPRRIAFPPYQFLMEACAGQQSLHRLRTFLLLLLRGLTVMVLALMFARPFFKPAGAASGAAAGARVVLVLDASLSMRAVEQGVPLFAKAQAEAADVLRGLEFGAEAAVILEGATPRALLPALSRNIPALHEALVKSLPTFECGDPASALALAAKMLGGAGTIYVFSDFQKSNWERWGTCLPGCCAACARWRARRWTTWPSRRPDCRPPNRSSANRWKCWARSLTAPPARARKACAWNWAISPTKRV